jgi:DNA-binding FrmR family transcriptional regulator
MKKPKLPHGSIRIPHHAKTSSVINRLSRIEGHVCAIKRMIENDTPCPEVLIQLAAVNSAVHKTSRVVLEDHIESCLTQAVTDGTADVEAAPVQAILSAFGAPMAAAAPPTGSWSSVYPSVYWAKTGAARHSQT